MMLVLTAQGEEHDVKLCVVFRQGCIINYPYCSESVVFDSENHLFRLWNVWHFFSFFLFFFFFQWTNTLSREKNLTG